MGIITKVVVGGVVKEDETKSNGESSHHGSCPVNVGERAPSKDKQSNRNEPARPHHGNKTHLRRRVSVELGMDLEVVCVDEGRASSGYDNSDGDGDEHQSSFSGIPTLSFLVDDGVGNEEHVEKTVQDGHVNGD